MLAVLDRCHCLNRVLGRFVVSSYKAFQAGFKKVAFSLDRNKLLLGGKWSPRPEGSGWRLTEFRNVLLLRIPCSYKIVRLRAQPSRFPIRHPLQTRSTHTLPAGTRLVHWLLNVPFPPLSSTQLAPLRRRLRLRQSELDVRILRRFPSCPLNILDIGVSRGKARV